MTERWIRRVAVWAAISAGTAIPASALAQAQAAEPADSGWFDETAQPETAPEQSAPAPAPATKNAAAPRPRPAAPAPAEATPDTDPSAITEFKPTLDPYGYWVEHPTYGLVWVPNREHVGPDFAPYVTSGHWALAEDGDWMWVSDYPFGWVVFHYGRWVWVSGNGWVWIPGRQYAHAWVTWRVPTGSYAYVGWAPMPPTYGWYGGVAVTLWYAPPVAYVFCPSGHVFHHHVHHYIVRDRYVIHRAAANTRRYVPPRVPATPRARTPAAPRTASAAPAPRASSPGGAAPRPDQRLQARSQGPSLAAARVPKEAIPRQRTAVNPRALEVARRTPSAGGRPSAAAVQRIANAPRPSPNARPSPSSPVYRAPDAKSAPRARPAPQSSAPAAQSSPRPAAQSSSPASRTVAPSRASLRPSPRAMPAPRTHSAPRSSSPRMPRAGSRRGGR